jgi:hypothetical protein
VATAVNPTKITVRAALPMMERLMDIASSARVRG